MKVDNSGFADFLVSEWREKELLYLEDESKMGEWKSLALYVINRIDSIQKEAKERTTITMGLKDAEVKMMGDSRKSMDLWANKLDDGWGEVEKYILGHSEPIEIIMRRLKSKYKITHLTANEQYEKGN